MPVYLISEEGHPDRAVKAISSSAAIAHVTRDRFTVENLKSADALADVFDRGITVEHAGEDKPATRVDTPEPEAEQDTAPNASAVSDEPATTAAENPHDVIPFDAPVMADV